MNWMTQIVMQRCITEWLRQDTLWEETKEGAFIYRLMSLSHDQWPYQMEIEDPLNPDRLRDELKIISENKVMQLPMGSKLQIYAAKYLQGLVEFLPPAGRRSRSSPRWAGTSPGRLCTGCPAHCRVPGKPAPQRAGPRRALL
ncbi:unnamed protein product [Prorocentrum cordatum]|uniref:Uncharacterized protein n=1 Tax=Prorocentrum cordatum TaxID=2364126 RepID=A0ABN9U8U6_9DINO|nr:unnamed protein product [Polarella glacialis]